MEVNGFKSFKLIEELSEVALPKLLEENKTYDFGFIDGWHTFDHTLLDFFYLNRMIKVGGMIIIDDANWNSVAKVVDYVAKYPCYELVLPWKTNTKESGLRKQILRLIIKLSRMFSQKNRKKIFSSMILLGKTSEIYPSMIGLRKIAEDNRHLGWFDDF